MLIHQDAFALLDAVGTEEVYAELCHLSTPGTWRSDVPEWAYALSERFDPTTGSPFDRFNFLLVHQCMQGYLIEKAYGEAS